VCVCVCVIIHYNSTYTDAGYPDRFGRSDKVVENSTILTCLETAGYRIKYSTALWLLELQIRRGRKVQTQVHNANSDSQISNCYCSLFSKKSLIIRIFCLSGCFAVRINPDKWSSTVCYIGLYCALIWCNKMSKLI